MKISSIVLVFLALCCLVIASPAWRPSDNETPRKFVKLPKSEKQTSGAESRLFDKKGKKGGHEEEHGPPPPPFMLPFTFTAHAQYNPYLPVMLPQAYPQQQSYGNSYSQPQQSYGSSYSQPQQSYGGSSYSQPSYGGSSY